MKILVTFLTLIVSANLALGQFTTLTVSKAIGVKTNAPRVELHVKGNAIIESNLMVRGLTEFYGMVAIGTNHFPSTFTIAEKVQPAETFWDLTTGNQWTWAMNTFTVHDGFFSLGYGDLSTGTNYLWLNPTNGNLHVAAGIDAQKITGNIEDSTNGLGFGPVFDHDTTLNVGGVSGNEGTINVYDSNTNLVASISGVYGNITTSGTNSASWFAGNGGGLSDVTAIPQTLNQVTAAGNSTTNSIIGNFVGTNSTTNVTANWWRNGRLYAYSDNANLNTSFGEGSFYNSALPVGSGLTAFGSSVLKRTITGASADTCVGTSSGQVMSTGSRNTGLGYQTFAGLTTGNDSTAIGNQALYSAVTNLENTAIGSQSQMYGTNGNGNTSVGLCTLQNNQGSQNVAMGRLTMQAATNVANSTAVGNFALQSMASGAQCEAFGYKALWQFRSGRNNLAAGFECNEMSLGSEMVTFGNFAGYDYENDPTGTNQTWSIIDSNMLFLGHCSGRLGNLSTNVSMTNCVALGNYSKVSQNNEVHLGNTATLVVTTSGDIISSNSITASKTITASNYVGQMLLGLGNYEFYTNRTLVNNTVEDTYRCCGTNQVITLPNCTNTPIGYNLRIMSDNGNGNVIITNANGLQTVRDGVSLFFKMIGVDTINLVNSGTNWYALTRAKIIWPNAQFSCTTNITLAAANTAYPVTFNSIDFNNSQGIALLTGTNANGFTSKIWITNAGQYEFGPSIVESFGGNNTIRYWFRQDNTNVLNSTTPCKRQSSGPAGGIATITVPFQVNVTGPTAFEIWAQSDSTTEELLSSAASGNYPASPSVICPVKRISDSRP